MQVNEERASETELFADLVAWPSVWNGAVSPSTPDPPCRPGRRHCCPHVQNLWQATSGYQMDVPGKFFNSTRATLPNKQQRRWICLPYGILYFCDISTLYLCGLQSIRYCSIGTLNYYIIKTQTFCKVKDLMSHIFRYKAFPWRTAVNIRVQPSVN